MYVLVDERPSVNSGYKASFDREGISSLGLDPQEFTHWFQSSSPVDREAIQGTWEFASYGALITLEASPEVTRNILAADSRRLRLRFEVPRGAGAGGLNLYGARAGSYPLNPTVILS